MAVHAFVPMPASHPIPAQDTQARFKVRFDHQPRVGVNSPDRCRAGTPRAPGAPGNERR